MSISLTKTGTINKKVNTINGTLSGLNHEPFRDYYQVFFNCSDHCMNGGARGRHCPHLTERAGICLNVLAPLLLSKNNE